MSKIIPVKTPVKRRRFSKAFKAKIVAACHQPGASVAGVALTNKLNANMVHRWLRAAKTKTVASPESADFIAISVHEPAQSADDRGFVILEVGSIKVHWPLSQIQHSIAWLRALQS
jgi:peptidyl-tRNA hydrolase